MWQIYIIYPQYHDCVWHSMMIKSDSTSLLILEGSFQLDKMNEELMVELNLYYSSVLCNINLLNLYIINEKYKMHILIKVIKEIINKHICLLKLKFKTYLLTLNQDVGEDN